MPNSWRIVVNCMELWLATVGDMVKVGELVHMYHLKESKEYGYYELVPWERKTRIVKGLPSSFKYWKSRFFFVSGTTSRLSPVGNGVMPRGCFISRGPRL